MFIICRGIFKATYLEAVLEVVVILQETSVVYNDLEGYQYQLSERVELLT